MDKEKRVNLENILCKIRDHSKHVFTQYFGTYEQIQLLNGKGKSSRLIIDSFGISAGLLSLINYSGIQNSNIASDISSSGSIVFFSFDWLYAMINCPSPIGMIRSSFQENLNFIKRKISSHNFKKNLVMHTNFSRLNLGDYQLLYFKRNFSREKMRSLIDLLNDTKKFSDKFPTVGVEIEYSSPINEKNISLLNESSDVKFNTVPKSYSVFDTSEIRVLPTNIYSFRWLMKEVMNFLPETKGSVQVSVGKVDDSRTPFVLLALYFSTPVCVFPVVVPEKSFIEDNFDIIPFPGAYVGQTVKPNGFLSYRNQTNYSFMHSCDSDEISDAAFYAAKLHSLNDKEFLQFKNELIEFLGITKDVCDILEKEVWPYREHQLYFEPTVAYQMPQNFIIKSIQQAKQNFGILDLENKIFELNEEDIDTLNETNLKVLELLQKYTVITPEDLIYRCSLEKTLETT